MWKTIAAAFTFMTARERLAWVSLLSARAMASVLDLLGILGIAFVVTSSALFLTGGSDPNRTVKFATLSIPAVNASSLPVFAAGIFGLFLLKGFISIALQRTTALFLAQIEARSAKKIAQSAFSGGLAETRRMGPEEVTYAIQISSPTAFNGVLNYFSILVSEGFLFIIVATALFMFNSVATIFALIYFLAVAALIQVFIGSKLSQAATNIASQSIKANSVISDLIRVFRELSVLGYIEKYIDQIYESRLAAASSSAKQNYISGMPRHIIETSLLIAVGCFIFYIGNQGDITSSAGTIGVFLSGGFRLTAAMLPLQNALLGIKNDTPTAKIALDILRDSDMISVDTKSIGPETKMPDRPFEVIAEKVSFSHGESSTFRISNFNLLVKAGTHTALIGNSGSGKSTIADLLSGIFTPASGRISVGGVNPAELTKVHSGAIGYVSQSPGLVKGSLVQNIALGCDLEDIDLDRINEVVSVSNLSSVVAKLPDGLNTDLGNHQDLLSGGEVQRLGLARALYPRPGLLILDEATSALDAEAESEVNRAIAALGGSLTVVTIAHRLNTIQNADVVHLIHEGQSIDSGSFKELFSRNETVRQFVELLRITESDE